MYAFVVGGNPETDEELLDDSTRPFVVPPSDIPATVNAPPNDLDQDDVLFLNIR